MNGACCGRSFRTSQSEGEWNAYPQTKVDPGDCSSSVSVGILRKHRQRTAGGVSTEAALESGGSITLAVLATPEIKSLYGSDPRVNPFIVKYSVIGVRSLDYLVVRLTIDTPSKLTAELVEAAAIDESGKVRTKTFDMTGFKEEAASLAPMIENQTGREGTIRWNYIPNGVFTVKPGKALLGGRAQGLAPAAHIAHDPGARAHQRQHARDGTPHPGRFHELTACGNGALDPPLIRIALADTLGDDWEDDMAFFYPEPSHTFSEYLLIPNLTPKAAPPRRSRCEARWCASARVRSRPSA